jgi:serine/threonine-protein kinase HipA
MIDKLDVFLNIYKKELKVGQLAYMDKKIYFEYAKSFLTTGIEISPYKLPLKNGVMVCDDDLFEGLFGVFADSLPDGWGRLLLDRYFLKHKIAYHDITPLDRLAYIGNFGIGALSYRPIIDDSMNSVKNIDLDKLADDSSGILCENSTECIDDFLVLGGSSSGARPKIMVQINDNDEMVSGSQKLKSAYNHYMVKFASSLDNKNIGKEEYRYSLMAKKAGIDMPNTKLLKGNSTTYLGEGKNPTQEHLIELASLHNIKNANLIIDKVKSSIEEI